MMNRIIGLLILTCSLNVAFSQSISQSNVPAVVLNSFQLSYPTAEEIKWKKDQSNYRIRYKVNKKSHDLTMDYKGMVIKHTQDLYLSEIPQNVLETIRAKISYFDLQDADLVEKEGKVIYETKFKFDGSNIYFWINEKGELQKYRRELKDEEIPASVLNAIKSQYGKFDIERAKYVEDGGNTNYIIGAEINDKDHVFWFDIKANLLKHTQDLKDSEIPAAILKKVNSDYKNYDVRDADLIEIRENVTYVLKLKGSEKQVYITFNKAGKVLETK
ncbi:Putative beta-lactamase-inhibitor-like, PepSY-like [Spirosomataceae bacterium TFI 002]|nr:Putative beta-lactamase-inhibitor-like, PepSY-like [Spirosomataceae bacterium TFI 002]